MASKIKLPDIGTEPDLSLSLKSLLLEMTSPPLLLNQKMKKPLLITQVVNILPLLLNYQVLDFNIDIWSFVTHQEKTTIDLWSKPQDLSPISLLVPKSDKNLTSWPHLENSIYKDISMMSV